jgi:hypothetical protein
LSPTRGFSTGWGHPKNRPARSTETARTAAPAKLARKLGSFVSAMQTISVERATVPAAICSDSGYGQVSIVLLWITSEWPTIQTRYGQFARNTY